MSCLNSNGNISRYLKRLALPGDTITDRDKTLVFFIDHCVLRSYLVIVKHIEVNIVMLG